MSTFFDEYQKGPEIVPPGEYAMWFPSSDEPTFTSSLTEKNIARIYELLEDIATYALADLLRPIDSVSDQVHRVALPTNLATFPVVGPENQIFIISASKEKGIRFHFHQSSTAKYRNRVLAGFLSHLESLSLRIERAGVEHDEATESPKEWWKGVETVVARLESDGGPIQEVGKLIMTKHA